MAGRSPLSRRRKLLLDEELNIAPIMNLFLVLIPSLMASIVLVKVGEIDAPIPKIVDKSQVPPRPKKAPFTLRVSIFPQGLVVESNALPKKKRGITNLPNGNLDLETLHALLVSLKMKYPNEKTISLRPSDSVIYDNIVKVMDASRELFSSDPPLPAGSKDADTNWLFPDVVVEGVI